MTPGSVAAGSCSYVVTLVIASVVNVPLNNLLDSTDPRRPREPSSNRDGSVERRTHGPVHPRARRFALALG